MELGWLSEGRRGVWFYGFCMIPRPTVILSHSTFQKSPPSQIQSLHNPLPQPTSPPNSTQSPHHPALSTMFHQPAYLNLLRLSNLQQAFDIRSPRYILSMQVCLLPISEPAHGMWRCCYFKFPRRGIGDPGMRRRDGKGIASCEGGGRG